MAEKQPWMKLWVKDILADEELKSCSLAARGLFLYMLTLMFRSVRRGYLTQANGQPYSYEQIARMVGCSTDEAAHLGQELLTTGVFTISEDGTGTIYSRRMVREASTSESRSKAGKAGADSTHSKVAKVLPRQNLGKPVGKVLGKVPGKPLDMVIEQQQTSSSEKEKEGIELNAAPGLGVQGEGVLPRQNLGKTENPDLSPEWLARVWCNECRAMKGRIARDKPEDVSPQFAEWIAFGVPAAEIDAEMRTPRDRTEHLWQFKQRLFDRLSLLSGRGGSKRKTKEEDRSELEKKLADEARELAKNSPWFDDHPDHEKWKAEQKRLGRSV